MQRKTGRIRNLTLLLALLLPGLAFAQTVVNGDFENVFIGPVISSNPNQVPGWTRSGALGDGLLAGVGFSDGIGSITVAGHGSQFVILGGGNTAQGTAAWTTTVTNLTPNTSYTLSFMIANEGEALSQSITASFPSGSSTGPQTFSTSTGSGQSYWKSWESKAMQFVATATSATLQFSVTNQQYDIGLDYVQVTAQGGGGGGPTITKVQLDKSPSSQCVASQPVTSFSTADLEIWSFLSVTNAQTGATLHVDWVDPNGIVQKTINFNPLPSPGSWCFDAWLSKAGDPLSPVAGNWTVRFVWNGSVLTSLQVPISGSSSTAALLGSPVMTTIPTSSCSSSPPPPAPFSSPNFQFLSTDPNVTVWFTLTGIAIGDAIKVNWTNPSGSVAYTYTFNNPVNGTNWFCVKSLTPATDPPGQWYVSAYWNTQTTPLFTQPFTLSGGGGGGGGGGVTINLQTDVLQKLNLAPGTYNSASVLASAGLTIVANAPNTTPPGAAGGIGTLQVTAVGPNEVHPPGTTTEAFFLGPGIAYNVLNCTTLAWTGAGSLNGFTITRPGMRNGASIPAWAMFAYDINSNQLATAGEGNLANGSFSEPGSYANFTLSSATPIARVVFCSHNGSSTYNALPLSGGNGSIGGGGPTTVTGNYTCAFGPFSSGTVTLTQNGSTVTGTLPNGGTLLGTVTVTVTTITVTASWMSTLGSGTITFTWDGTNLSGTWTRNNGNGDPGGAPATSTTGTVSGTQTSGGGGGGGTCTPASGGSGSYTLSSIVVTRTYGPGEPVSSQQQPGTVTVPVSTCAFAFGWSFLWPDPNTGPNHNTNNATVNLTQAPASVQPGATANFAASMTALWDNTGYGVPRDHLISLAGAAGSNQNNACPASNSSCTSGAFNGQFTTSAGTTVPAADSSGNVTLTLNATLYFATGNDWQTNTSDAGGTMQIQFVYTGAAGGGGGGGGGGGATVTGIALDRGNYNGSTYSPGLGDWLGGSQNCDTARMGDYIIGVSQAGDPTNPMLNPNLSLNIGAGSYFLYTEQWGLWGNGLAITLCYSDGHMDKAVFTKSDSSIFSQSDFAQQTQYTLRSGPNTISLASTGITTAKRVSDYTTTSDGSANDVLLLGIGGVGGGGGGGGGGGHCGSPITSNLVLCLDASQLTAGPVASWLDSSGQGHNAGPAPSPNQLPVAVTNAINGLGAVQFNGVNQSLQLAGGPVLTSPTYTIIALVTDETNANSPYKSYREVISDWTYSSAPNSVFLGTIGFNPTRVRFSDSVGGGQQNQTGQGMIANPASPFILSGISTSSDATIYQNSTPLYSLGHATQTLVLSNTYFVGLQGTINGEYWNGKIGEVLVYNSPLSPSDFNSVTTYLTNKWLGSTGGGGGTGGGGQPGCNYNVTLAGYDQNNPNTPVNFGAGVQRGNLFQVFSGPTCTWKTIVPANAQSWITNVTPAGGGGGSPQSGGSFDIEANTTGQARSATITIATALVTINQSASGACSYTVDPSPQQTLGIGGGGYFNVTVSGSGCSWTVNQPPPTVTWLHLVLPASTSTSGTVQYTIDPNSGASPLSYTLTIVGLNPSTTLTFTVSEGPAPCTYTLSGNSISLPGVPPPNPISGVASLTVRGPVCSWALTVPNDPATGMPVQWIHVTSSLSGSGSSPIDFVLDSNNTTAPRSVTLTIATKYPSTTLTYTVNQAPGPANTPPPPTINPGPGGITNSASFIPSSLPAGAVAQGSFFSIFGNSLGPSTFVKANSYPLGTTLGGVSVTVTGSNGVSVPALPVFVAQFQVNAIMPSNAPVGAVTVTVAFNGATSATQMMTVVPSAFGAFAVSAGRGPGIVQNALADGTRPLNSSALTAAPGDYVVLWGTGLGPLSASLTCAGASVPDQCSPDTSFKPQVSSIQVFVGGLPANMQDQYAYAARAPQISGVDQVQFPLPLNVATGCYVPIQLAVNGKLYSNTVTLAIDANRKPCADANPLSTLSRNGGKNANIVLARLTYTDVTSPSITGTADAGLGLFLQEQAGGSLGFDFFSSLPPLNSCTYYNNLNVFSSILGGQPITKAGEQYLDAGYSLSVASAAGGPPKAMNPANQNTGYLGLFGASGAFASAGAGGLFLNAGSFTVSGNGGAGVGPFKFNLTMPPSGATWTNRDVTSLIDRTQPLTFIWAGGNPATQVGIIAGFSNDQDTSVSGGFTCLVSLGQQTFSVPPGMMANLPPTTGPNVQSSLLFLTFPSASQFVKFSTIAGPSLDAGLAYYAIGDLRNVAYK